MENKKRKVILVIRDGWGYNPNKEGNFILEAGTPATDELMQKYPNTLIKASGEAVGLPEGYQGNSEIGHMTIGAGRIIWQAFPRINKSIESGDFFANKEILFAIENCKKNNSSLHIMGLLQTEAVHSHIDHLFALLEFCKKENFHNVFVHVFTDGRDAPQTAGIEKVKILQEKLDNLGFGKIATVSGRYFAMDRDKRWDRTKKAYDCIVGGIANQAENVLDEIKNRYANNETDEFIVPFKIGNYQGVKENDSIIFFNFRTDRTRQLTQAIIEKDFQGWQRNLIKVTFVCMTKYYAPMNAKVIFDDQKLDNLLCDVIAKNNLKQLRISETEKYAHVTFFFNGQKEEPSLAEDRIMISSPKVETYDLKPEMSVYEVTEKLVQEINSEKYNFIVTNLVNCDMVGHTANKEAILKAIKSVDECVGKITQAGLANNYDLLIFADHGNAENKSGEFSTSHTKNPVPLIFVSSDFNGAKLVDDGGLADIAPTVLELMGIEKPAEMTGTSLVEK